MNKINFAGTLLWRQEGRRKGAEKGERNEGERRKMK